jgi:hypothetical protein
MSSDLSWFDGERASFVRRHRHPCLLRLSYLVVWRFYKKTDDEDGDDTEKIVNSNSVGFKVQFQCQLMSFLILQIPETIAAHYDKLSWSTFQHCFQSVLSSSVGSDAFWIHDRHQDLLFTFPTSSSISIVTWPLTRRHYGKTVRPRRLFGCTLFYMTTRTISPWCSPCRVCQRSTSLW